ncbi:MAG: UbiA-like polyprenyltransferase [Desulfovibrionaceae bacterium]
MNILRISTPFGTFAALCRMVKIEHSVFALPYAYAGAFLAAQGMPAWSTLVWLTVAMVAVRSFAMAFNRVADLRYDRINPRTQGRPLVTGDISPAQTWAFCAFMAVVFIMACAGMNTLCVMLAVPALLFSAAYSLLKRFTWICHFWLGATLGLAPLAGWISVTESVTLTPLLLFWGVTFWVAAFDIFYSCQDVDFDREQGLHSVPADFGIPVALVIAAFSHVITALFFGLMGLSAQLSVYWYAVWLCISVILLWEHKIIRADDLSRVDTAFFTLNGIISVVVFTGVLLGLYL